MVFIVPQKWGDGVYICNKGYLLLQAIFKGCELIKV